jgi:hypothetical protein
MKTSMTHPFQARESLLGLGHGRDRRSYYYSQVLAVNRMEKRRQVLEQRTRFALFLRILLKRLERSGEKDLLQQAKRIVSICNKRHKMGDPKFAAFVDSMETALRKLVGEQHWIRCHSYMRYYVLKKQATKQQRSF